MPHIWWNENFSWEQPCFPVSVELTFCAMPEPCLSLTFVFCFFCLQPCWTHLEQPGFTAPALSRGQKRCSLRVLSVLKSPQPVCNSMKSSMKRGVSPRQHHLLFPGCPAHGCWGWVENWQWHMKAVSFMGIGLVLISWSGYQFCFLRGTLSST